MVSAGRKASDYMSHKGELSSFGPYLIRAAGRGLADAAKDLLFAASQSREIATNHRSPSTHLDPAFK